MVAANQGWLARSALHIRELQWLQSRKVHASSVQSLLRFGTLKADGGPIFGGLELHLVHDDKALQVGIEFFDLAGIGFEHKIVAAIIDIEISQDVALRIKHKCVNAMPSFQVADVVADHAVQPAQAVAATDGEI